MTAEIAPGTVVDAAARVRSAMCSPTVRRTGSLHAFGLPLTVGAVNPRHRGEPTCLPTSFLTC
jgi:hypothetical protein